MSVRFFRLDKLKVEQALERYTASLAEDPHVLGVVLFGSLARGDATAMSDADILIVLSESTEPFQTRVPAFLRSGIGISMDVFPYTLEEALHFLHEGKGVLPVALREGRWLLDRGNVHSRLESVLRPVEGGIAGRAGADR